MIIKKNYLIPFLIWLLFLFTVTVPAYSTGTSAATILKYAPGPRQQALGGCGSTVYDDFSSINYNPALLATVKGLHLSMYYDTALDDASIYYAGLGKSFKPVSIAFSATIFEVGEIAITDRGDPLHGKTVKAQADYIYSLVLAKKLFNNFYIGASPKFYSSTLAEEFSASTVAFDAGVFYKTGFLKMGKEKIKNKLYSNGLDLGVSAKNLGGEIKYDTVADPIPFQIRGGILYPLRLNDKNSLHISGEGIKTNEDKDLRAGAGLEYIYDNMFFGRFGYSINYTIRALNWGLGLKYSWFKLDYCMLTNSAINSQHQVLFTLSPKKSTGPKTPKAKVRKVKKVKSKTKVSTKPAKKAKPAKKIKARKKKKKAPKKVKKKTKKRLRKPKRKSRR